MSKELNKAPVEQAGGDERAAFEYWASDEGLYPKAVERAGNCYKLAQTQSYWMAWQARAALAQPSLMPPDRGPWHAVKWDGGRRVDLSSDDFEHDVALTVSGDFVEGDKFRYAQELAAWMNAHLAQPSPVQAEQHWPKLEKPAQVGGVRFSAGVSSRLVVEAAQRLYEFESTPEQEAERIERLQAFREQCFEPLGTEFSKVLSDNLPELLSTAQAEQAEAERPEVVARVVHSNPIVLGQCGPLNANDELMTVAQHAASVAHWAEMFNRVEQERDAALARVAELEALMQMNFGELHTARNLLSRLSVSGVNVDAILGGQLQDLVIVPADATLEMVEALKRSLTVTNRGTLLNAGHALNASIAASPFAKKAPEPVMCPRCEGEGTLRTGIDESPSTICKRCDGVGTIAAAPGKEGV